MVLQIFVWHNYKVTVTTIIYYFSVAKFDKLDSYTSKALRLRVNPEIDDFNNKNIKKTLKVRGNTDLYKSKLKVTPLTVIFLYNFFPIYILL